MTFAILYGFEPAVYLSDWMRSEVKRLLARFMGGSVVRQIIIFCVWNIYNAINSGY